MNNALLPFIQKSLVLAISAALATTASSVASANPPAATTITLDGHTGSSGVTTLSPLIPGSTTYTIDGSSVGTVVSNGTGHNLFFSFSQFDLVNKADIASFTCSGSCGVGLSTAAPGTITNIISGVNGPSGASYIYGTLQASGFTAKPDFWFFNPSGVIFGPNTSINVPAAFHISTAASLINNITNTAWTPGTTPTSSDLGVAAPNLFGFSGSTSGDITISGSNIILNNGSTFDSGRDVTINNSQIVPNSGTLQITAQGSISVDSTPAPSPAVSSTLTANLNAGTTLTNNGTIIGDATANGDNTVTPRLNNTGTITGNATSSLAHI